MTTVVFFLEEESAKAMLQGVLPRLLPEDVVPRIISFEGKSDLEKQLEGKLRGWRTPNTCFVVLRDKDGGDCVAARAKLQGLCAAAGKPDVLVRIACHELESWYIGDLDAVETGLAIPGIAAKQAKAKYRNPDTVANAAEEMKKLTDNQYQKVAGSRAIGLHLKLEGNRSHSFNKFVSGVRRLLP